MSGNDVPAEVVALVRRNRGWITAEPRDGIYHVEVHWCPELAHLARTFDEGARALIYVLQAAEQHGLVAVVAFRPGE